MPQHEDWQSAPELRTDRLILRAHQQRDVDDMHHIWTDPGVGGKITPKEPSKGETWKRLLQYSGLWSVLGYGYWAIELRQTDQFIGEAGLAQFYREVSPEFDNHPEAGWILSRSHHSRGYATEAMKAILAWSEEQRQIETTVALVNSDNLISLQLAATLGYEKTEVSPLASRTLYLQRRVKL